MHTLLSCFCVSPAGFQCARSRHGRAKFFLLPALAAAALLLTACGGGSSSGNGSRFDETEISFRNLGTTVECDGTVVERGVNPNGSTWIRCTWPCGINGPQRVERHFYVRKWQRPDRASPFQFIGDRVEDSICR